jgi:hypothetical protein
MERDRLGRRRSPDQERGLRPLHPPLPEQWISRALRVAMSQGDWDRFEALVRQYGGEATTQARAYGLTLSQLVHQSAAQAPPPGPLDWMDWERRKALRLLKPGA